MTVTKKPWQLSANVTTQTWNPEVPHSNEVAVMQAVGLDDVVDMPYEVQKGWDLHLSDAHFVSKHVQYGGTVRNSYMHLIIEWANTWTTMLTLTSEGPDLSLTTPFILRSGSKLKWGFANNGPEPENMSGVLTGVLRKATT